MSSSSSDPPTMEEQDAALNELLNILLARLLEILREFEAYGFIDPNQVTEILNFVRDNQAIVR